MENKGSPSKNKLISIQEDRFISEGAYDCISGNSTRLPKKLLLNLEILKNHKQPSQKLLVSVKQRVPSIKTVNIAEKSRFRSKRGSEKSQPHSRLGIGDQASFNTYCGEDESSVVSSTTCIREKKQNANVNSEPEYSSTIVTRDRFTNSKSSKTDETKSDNLYNDDRKRSDEKCYIYNQPHLIMNLPTIEKINKSKATPQTADIGGFVAIPTFEDSDGIPLSAVKSLYKRIELLERKIQRQEMVFRALDPSLNLSSSDEECKESKLRSTCGAGRPGCSYIQQYSHVPDRSAFQRYAQQTTPLSPSKATTIDKEHNSEQYGRDFTTYDGLTTRGRRQSASVPGKRDEGSKMAAERVNKIRHKLNPVRDYRLMDTVHYLAQGEFAPRDDGIKLTPSREAVLSDIIWEDVCRTHWPNARLGKRGAERGGERCNTRSELQRLIDSLLRERVAHVERRRRRHYRIVKLNHRHENSRPLGKTGDIIVASHKNKETNENREVSISDHNAASAIMARRRWEECAGRCHRSHDRLVYLERRNRHRSRQEEGVAGPSYAPKHPPTCCYHTTSPGQRDMRQQTIPPRTHNTLDLTSTSSNISRVQLKPPRLVVKKEIPRRKSREEASLEQLILLPTLVIRTPSNVRRQKKFNELYHRILNSQLKNAQNCTVGTEAVERRSHPNSDKRDIGLNINITLSGSEEKIQKSKKSI